MITRDTVTNTPKDKSMKFQIGQLAFEITARSFKVEGFIETTQLKVFITHQIFGGNVTEIEVQVGELVVTGKI